MGTNAFRQMTEEKFINIFRKGLSQNNFIISNILKNTVVLNLSYFTRNINKCELFKINKLKQKNDFFS